MSWREAFLLQARSDYALFVRLGRMDVAACHRVHYFQMVCEKLAKAWLIPKGSRNPPKAVHKAFVSLLRQLKQQTHVMKRLGFRERESFGRYVDSLLSLSAEVESLAPALAGFS